MATLTEQVIEAVAKALVENNIDNFRECVIDDPMTLDEAKTYGVCEENIIDLVKHLSNQILERATQIQADVVDVFGNNLLPS